MIEIFILVLVASLLVLLFLLSRLWKMRHAAGALELFLCTLACGLWAFGYLWEIISPDLAQKLFWAKFQYSGIAFITTCVLCFVVRYSGRAARFNVKQIVSLFLIPCLTLIFTATNEWHHWMWTDIALQTDWAMAPLSLGHGWWFWVEILYSYVLLTLATVLLIQFVFYSQKIYLSQALMMLAGMFAPWLGNALYILGIRPGPNLDLTPVFFTITNIGLVIGFMRLRLLDILPVAYSSVFKFIRDGVIVLDNQDRIVDLNPAARNIFNQHSRKIIRRDRLTRMEILDAFVTHPIDELIVDWQDHKEEYSNFAGKEVKLWDEIDQTFYIYSVRTTPIHNARKQITGRVLVMTDMTKIKKDEEQLRLQAAALEAVHNGVVITNPRGEIEWVNQGFTALTGYSKEEAQGVNPRILKSGQHPESFYADLWETISMGIVWQGELSNKKKDGCLYFEEMTITPMLDADRQILHFIAVKQDISTRKEAEEQLKTAHQAALESNRLKTQLLANVSHDMRTPLGAIIGYADMLNTGTFGSLNKEQFQSVREIQDSADQLLLFINNLIGQAQFETGKIVLHPKLFQVNSLIETVLAVVKASAERKNILVECEVALDLPGALYGDIYWLRQIVLNLLNNAVKFTEKGRVKLHLFRVDKENWAIEVSDTGIGIAEDLQERIFQPFLRGDHHGGLEKSGSGLGLAIVKELSSLMNGKISMESTPGKGSTFRIVFPFVQ